jgi:hypothetical protein
MKKSLECKNRNSCECEQSGKRDRACAATFRFAGASAGKKEGFMQIALLFPKTDTGILQWSQNVVNLITPVPADWGLVTLDVTNYTALHTGYSDALAACDPSVRNKPAVVTKNAALANLKTGAAIIANKIYAAPAVTDAMKVQIGMPPRATPQPIPAPSSAPVIEIISTLGATVRIRLRAGDGAGRGKPAGTIGASLFSYVGATAPGDLSGWTFEGNTGRVNKIDVAFPDSVAKGATVWLTAFWFNGRKQSGPITTPVSVNLPGGGVSMAA